ncbi:MAG: PaaI family thioesterase [Propionibacteriaceae bacterium]|nr:PaaI family thioesterase [Propionibacteriaceae bacterium]
MDFVEQWHSYYAECFDMVRALRLEPVSGSPQEVRVRMPLHTDVSQPQGYFAGPALIALSDITASWLGMVARPADGFPLLVQMSASLVSNTNQGYANACATPVKFGRRLWVVNVEVTDDDGKVLLTATGSFIPQP